RLCRIDGASARGPIAFADIVRLLWLTPAQDGLFTGPAGDRRRFLDRIAQTHSVGHAKAGAEFETALRQRQKLLEAGRYDEGWLSAIEAQLAEAAVAVATARREAAAILASFDVSSLAGGAFPSAEIVLEGDLESALEGSPITDVEDWYQTELSRRRPMDAEAGRTTLGPHKSDLVVRYRAKDTLAKHASTGEQKALLIGLILANACALAGRAQTTPLVLLFDEIAAHLDPDRRAALFDILGGLGHQCFMTGTDDTLFAAWGDRAQGFRVDEGAVTAL
ncbi:MAG: DNA replication and repair protein RecF, partial [Pseudomonadota bacterium]